MLVFEIPDIISAFSYTSPMRNLELLFTANFTVPDGEGYVLQQREHELRERMRFMGLPMTSTLLVQAAAMTDGDSTQDFLSFPFENHLHAKKSELEKLASGVLEDMGCATEVLLCKSPDQ